MSTAPTTAPRRIEIFDGLRGIAIILVVLSHGWTIWPFDYILENPALRGMFTAGNFAVSIFFVVGAFLSTRKLLAKTRGAEGLHPVVEIGRRYLRLTGQVFILLLAVMAVSVLDTTDPYVDSSEATLESAGAIVTHTWNWYILQDPVTARADLGHLWFLSVYFQALVLITLIVFMLRRRPGWLVITLAALIIASWAWTAHVSGTESTLASLLRTSVRIDASLAGALAAASLPYLQKLRKYAARLLIGATVSLLPLMYAATHGSYFGIYGRLTIVALFTLVISAALAPSPGPVAVILARRPLAVLGRRSLSTYAWHYPIFYFTARHNVEWDWWWRTALALGLTALCVVLSEWLVESRVQRILQAPAWRQLDYGIRAYVRRRWTSWRTRRAAAPEEGPPPRQHTSA